MSETETVDAEATEEEPEVTNLPAVRAAEAIVARGELSVDEVVAQKDKIVQIMQRVMKDGVHYGLIPGIKKPSLLKPGAEAINVALRLAPHYRSEKIWHEDGHLTVVALCELKHIPTDLTIATGEGLCTSREDKYAYRNAKRVCPICGAPAIIKGKAEYGGGWVCWKKEDGCGASFQDGDETIESQEAGKIPNPQLADQYNTVLKMADKRALVAAVLNGTAASDVFTQDAEDKPAPAAETAPAAPAEPQERRQEAPKDPVPKSWTKLYELLRAGCDNWEETEALFAAFLRAASYHLFGEADPQKLTPDQRKGPLFQKAAGAVLALREKWGPGISTFTIYEADMMRAAWASVLGGVALEIPDYVAPDPPPMDPDLEAQREAEAIADDTFTGP